MFHLTSESKQVTTNSIYLHKRHWQRSPIGEHDVKNSSQYVKQPLNPVVPWIADCSKEKHCILLGSPQLLLKFSFIGVRLCLAKMNICLQKKKGGAEFVKTART